MARRLAIPPVVLAALLVVALTPSAGAAAQVPAGVKLTDCSAETQAATFQARMSQVAGTQRMALRFRLLEKGTDGYHVLKAPGLSRWHRSDPGVGTFAYRQVVRGLQSGARYRAQVDFRWYDASGDVIETARRRSPTCRQFDSLPNLAARLMRAVPTRQRGVVRYVVRAVNRGAAAATEVPVTLSVDDHVVETVTVPSLLPGERRTVGIRGPECTSTVEAIADPDGLIVESGKDDNVDERACADLLA